MQRGMSASSKLARSAGTTTAYSISQKRTSEKGRSGPTLVSAASEFEKSCRICDLSSCRLVFLRLSF